MNDHNHDENKTYDDVFRDYFHTLLDDILEGVVAKAKVYGTQEMDMLGGVFRQVAELPRSEKGNDDFLTAVWMYASGKLARWTAAVRRGEQPSVDTVQDLFVYCAMYLKVRETGEWYNDLAAIEHDADRICYQVTPQGLIAMSPDDEDLDVPSFGEEEEER